MNNQQGLLFLLVYFFVISILFLIIGIPLVRKQEGPVFSFMSKLTRMAYKNYIANKKIGAGFHKRFMRNLGKICLGLCVCSFIAFVLLLIQLI